MNLMKPAVAALAIAMAATTFAPTADARSRHRNHQGAFFAGAAGFAAGALLGSLAQPRYRCGYYDDCYAPRYSRSYYDQPRYYYRDEPRYYRAAPVYLAPQPRVYYQPQPRVYYQEPTYAYDRCGDSGVSRPATSMC